MMCRQHSLRSFHLSNIKANLDLTQLESMVTLSPSCQVGSLVCESGTNISLLLLAMSCAHHGCLMLREGIIGTDNDYFL